MFKEGLFFTLGVRSIPLPDADALDAVERDAHSVTDVTFNDTKFKLADWQRFAALKLPKLRTLDLCLTRLKPESLEVLASASWAKQLTGLDLSGNPKLGAAMDLLEGFPKLLDLRLSETKFDDASARALATLPFVPRLRRLDLASNALTAVGIAALAKHLKAIEQLALGGNRLDEAVLPVVSLAKWPRLTHLELVGKFSKFALAALPEHVKRVMA